MYPPYNQQQSWRPTSQQAPSPNYYNTFVQPMVPQPQQQLQGTSPTGAQSGFLPSQPNAPIQPQQGNQGSGPSDNWTTPSPKGMGGYNGSGQGPQTAINTQQAFQGLGTPDLHDHSQLMKLADNLKQQGHNVQPGGIDEYGRMDSLYIDGELHKVFDSTGHWIMQASPGGYSDAWGSDGSGSSGNQGTMPSQGGQDPNAWRRQHEMRQNQRPDYSGGSWNQLNQPYQNGLQPNINGGYDMSRSSEGPGGITGHAQDPNYWKISGTPNYTSQNNYLTGTAPSSFANQNGAPTNHPMNQRLMY